MSVSESPRQSSVRSLRPLVMREEQTLIEHFIAHHPLAEDSQAQACVISERLVSLLREGKSFSFLEFFLAHTRLESEEGQCLMVLAEAMLRTPDSRTQIALLADCLQRANGAQLVQLFEHQGSSVYRLGGRLLPRLLHWINQPRTGLVGDINVHVARRVVRQAIRHLGSGFVLGETIQSAWHHSETHHGYTYSYDMLGEAAVTRADAERYFEAYRNAIRYIGRHTEGDDFRDNPGVSVKLSALSPRYQRSQRDAVLTEVAEKVAVLAQLASQFQLGLTLDAEESHRLELQLDVVERVLGLLRTRVSARWEGFGVAVQAYGRRAPQLIDWLRQQSIVFGRKLSVRLVKGAYWDSEIKRAQVLGLKRYPVYTSRAATDLSYLYCAGKLFEYADHLYPQFATHNAHTVAAIHTMAQKYPLVRWEYQRLHGMGEGLYELVLGSAEFHIGTGGPPSCRIYAPVGKHEQLLAYLVRRMLENGANASFVHQAANLAYSESEVTQNPLSSWHSQVAAVAAPADLYAEGRVNARGFDLANEQDLNWLFTQRQPWLEGADSPVDEWLRQSAAAVNHPVNQQTVQQRVIKAQQAQTQWADCGLEQRCQILRDYADLVEQHTPELLALLAREAGKTLPDAVAEIRETVDFARYYAAEAQRLCQGSGSLAPLGVIACISPWNFPLAIFSGPVLAALVSGNTVVAKPAEQTPAIAVRAVQLMHEAGVPDHAIQLLLGPGETVGEWLLQQAEIQGVCFTGSVATAQRIHHNMAKYLLPGAVLMAETGGINAMVVDSTALPEQVVDDVISSAFLSAGQRCSALRVLYLQDDIADNIMSLLTGAMDVLVLGDPAQLGTDIGPLIDEPAWQHVSNQIEQARRSGQLLHQAAGPLPTQGWFIAPALIQVAGIDAVTEEIFGPVLHIAQYGSGQLDQVIDDINRSGYGLTFAIHSRLKQRTRNLVRRVKVGNVYVNRNQVGAVVGSQPFGGEGLSGTGPKAGGPHYLQRFLTVDTGAGDVSPTPDPSVSHTEVQEADIRAAFAQLESSSDGRQTLDTLVEGLEQLALLVDSQIDRKLIQTMAKPQILPGPTGERNELSLHPRGPVLCLSQHLKNGLTMALAALNAGNRVVLVVAEEQPERVRDALTQARLPLAVLSGAGMPSGWLADDTEGKPTDIALVACSRDVGVSKASEVRQALAGRPGRIIPFLLDETRPSLYLLERHICIDTTAGGGDLNLLSRVR